MPGSRGRQKSGPAKEPAEKVVKDIRRIKRRKFSAEEKIRIVLEGLRGEESIAELCRRVGIVQNLYYRWSKDFLEAGKKRLAGDTARVVTSEQVKDLSEQSRKRMPHFMRKAVVCLVLLSLVFLNKAFAAAEASSFGAGPSQPSSVYCTSVNSHSVGKVALAQSTVPGHSCPCPPCDRNALTCCGPTFCSHFVAITSEVVFRPQGSQTVVIRGGALSSASSCLSQVFRPPKFANQA